MVILKCASCPGPAQYNVLNEWTTPTIYGKAENKLQSTW